MNERKNHTSRWVTVAVLLVISSREYTRADFTFGEPTNLGPTVNSPRSDGLMSITANGLSLFFNSNRPGGYGNYDVWVATREEIDGDWSEPTNLGPTINSSVEDGAPSISADGLTLFFESSRPGGYGNNDLYVTTRQTSDDSFGPPVNLGSTVNSSSLDSGPCISFDGLALFFMSSRPGGSGGDNIWFTTRETTHGEWSAPVNLGPNVNGSGQAGFPYISDDGLLLFFASLRAGGFGSPDIWLSKRNTKDDPWGVAVNLGPEVNSSRDELAVCISGDWTTLFFSSRRPGGIGDQDIWQASIDPVVDFNGDGIVDSGDMQIMVNHWGEDYSLCDIGPTPFGDGVVDVQDLIVLAEHLLPVFLAHWELDEIEGSIAYDSVGDHNAMLNGNPLWQPADGKVSGALQLDGVDDYVSTPSILDAAKRPLSAFAWIKGGEPGQVLLSQTDGFGYGAAWIYADSSGGGLATKLMDPQPALESESMITDGAWHHIGLVWDESCRYLYVDGAEVAKDAAALSYAVNSDGGLHVGAGKTLEAGSFFSGLIDDVRIYRRALSAEEIAALAY